MLISTVFTCGMYVYIVEHQLVRLWFVRPRRLYNISPYPRDLLTINEYHWTRKPQKTCLKLDINLSPTGDQEEIDRYTPTTETRRESWFCKSPEGPGEITRRRKDQEKIQTWNGTAAAPIFQPPAPASKRGPCGRIELQNSSLYSHGRGVNKQRTQLWTFEQYARYKPIDGNTIHTHPTVGYYCTSPKSVYMLTVSNSITIPTNSNGGEWYR